MNNFDDLFNLGELKAEGSDVQAGLSNYWMLLVYSAFSHDVTHLFSDWVGLHMTSKDSKTSFKQEILCWRKCDLQIEQFNNK